MTSNGTLQDGSDERHDVWFRKRWRCLLRVKALNRCAIDSRKVSLICESGKQDIDRR